MNPVSTGLPQAEKLISFQGTVTRPGGRLIG